MTEKVIVTGGSGRLGGVTKGARAGLVCGVRLCGGQRQRSSVGGAQANEAQMLLHGGLVGDVETRRPALVIGGGLAREDERLDLGDALQEDVHALEVHLGFWGGGRGGYAGERGRMSSMAVTRERATLHSRRVACAPRRSR